MTDQSTVQSDLWSRLTLEGLVIVVSILLAFALDAAWDNRQEGIRRDEYLRVLEDEFLAAADEMQEQIEDHERQVRSINTLLEELGAGRDFSANAFRNLNALYYFGPAHPVFTDLANTSSVDILEFPELRYALFRYGRQKEFLVNLHNRETVLYQQDMRPYLARRFVVSNQDEASSDATVRRINADKVGFHEDEYLQNLLTSRRGIIRSQLRVDRDIAAAIGEILQLIEVARAN
jgi:hypothetical protein